MSAGRVASVVHGAHLQVRRWIAEHRGVLGSEVRTGAGGAVIVITYNEMLSAEDREDIAGRLVGYPVRFELEPRPR
jgi:hypothetical protein